MESTNTLTPKQESRYMALIGVLSVAVPVVVAVLLFSSFKFEAEGTRILAHFNAALNTLTSICLIAGFVAIKNKNVKLHRSLMTSAFALSSLFLVSYVIYHATAESVKFGDANFDGAVDLAEKNAVGAVRYVYYFILLTHILLATVIIPFVLVALYYAVIAKDYVKHKKVTRIGFPMWAYVAITGVVVYLMISPYYPS